jgi:threonine/homoserine/homoserine lactone efflux protein
MTDFFQNILLGITLAAPIGPASIAIIRNGLKHGFWGGFMTALGVVSADTTYLLIVYLGLSTIITIPAVKLLIWVFGAIVLLYLGYQSIKDSSKNIDIARVTTKIKSGNLFVSGYGINISNPMAVVWWGGVFGSILANSLSSVSKISALLLSFSIVIGIMMWHTFLSLLTHWGNRILNKTLFKYISIFSGLILIWFGLTFGYKAFGIIVK